MSKIIHLEEEKQSERDQYCEFFRLCCSTCAAPARARARAPLQLIGDGETLASFTTLYI